MSSKPVQMFSGAESVMAANSYREALQTRREQWPYVHAYPPPSADDVHVIGTLLVPAVNPNANVTVVRYQVDAGKRFYLQGVVMGANVAFNPGDSLFSIFRNADRAVDTQLMPEHGLVNIGVQLGSFTASEPWKLHRAREFAALDVISIRVVNIAITPAATTFYACGLFGYVVPSLEVDSAK